ncbi:MAG: amino acid adenylation domain-containing protein [Rhodocyclaceae bacterium]
MTALNKKSLHAVIDHLLARRPGAIAIEQGEHRIDYRQLGLASTTLAHRLRAAGVAPGVIVALPMPASVEYVVAVLATVRAGGIFMPLDPAWPDERLRRVFTRARPGVVVTRDGETTIGARLANCAGGAGGAVPCLGVAAVQDLASTDEGGAPAPLPVTAGDDDTGYLIHTSGSTGEPKLIAGRNKGVSHFVHWEVAELGLDEHVRASFFAPPTFDVSLREIFVPLLAGGTLVIPEPDVRADIARLVDWLRARSVSLMHSVPSLFRLITRALRDAEHGGLPALRHVCLAGEPLFGADVAAWHAVNDGHGHDTPSCALINLYGPSETTLAKAFHRIDRESYAPGAIVPIGQPIANTALLLLRDGRLAEIGEIGEIHIRTPFMSNGYWQDPARTAETFVANPLSEQADTIYRTGDLGRYRADRSVEFVGRADRQVKIDGVRIELPEIEGALRAHPAIDEAAAHVFRLTDGGLALVGYFTSHAGIEAAAVRSHLETLLPGAMIPGHLVALPALPKNLNGKIDRKALPRPDALLGTDHAYSAPDGPTETRLAALWADALGVERVGATSPWLAVGGNSLRAIGLIGRINRAFDTALTIRDFLQNGTIRAQAKLIQARRADDLPPLERAPEADDYPLTDEQRRLWILSRLESGATLYNNVEWLQLDGELDDDALARAFQALVDRHESLRTGFIVNADGEPRQRILPQLTIDLPRASLPPIDEARHDAAPHPLLVQTLAAERSTAFDLEHGPLLRLHLFHEGALRHHLLVTMHHIVCDGWSMGLLIDDLAAAYAAARDGRDAGRPAPALRPRDIAHWRARVDQGALFTRCRDYWRTRLADADQRAQLPTDPLADGPARLAGSIDVDLPRERVTALRALLAERGATPFMAVAVALATLLQRYGGRDQVILGVPLAARSHPDMEGVVGFFVNTLPLVLHLAPEHSFATLLEQAGRAIGDLHAHSALPFDGLLAEFGDGRDPLTNPLFEVFLAAEPTARDLGIPGLALTEHEPPDAPARYDLTLRFADDGEHWRLRLEYRRSLWSEAFMRRFARHLSHWLDAAATAPDQPLGELDMLASDERQCLRQWAQGPHRPLPQTTLPGAFARRAAQMADAPALRVDAGTEANPAPGAPVPSVAGASLAFTELSYAQLAAQAARIATGLRDAHGLRPGDIVAVLLPRDARWPAALLGVLASHATVMPLDPAHPASRIEELLHDAEPALLIADDDTHPACRHTPRITFDALLAAGDTAPGTASSPPHVPPDSPVDAPANIPATSSAPDATSALATFEPFGDPDAAAYLIYTSGSTGTPKGVLVSHRAFLNMLEDQIDALGVGAGDVVMQFLSPAFDAALFEFFLALLSGASAGIPARHPLNDAGEYVRTVDRLGATAILLTPGFLRALGDAPLSSVRLVISGGEPPIIDDVARVLATGKRYINAYGPTEAAVNATLHEIRAGEPLPRRVPLGRATANTLVDVIAPDGSLLPPGITGELRIAGAGVALGYLRRPAQTTRLFGTGPDGTRHYRSGDRVRREADGSLIFVGRVDDQVKVRGHRIELGEVEHALTAVPGVRAARVVARQQGGETRLTGYWLAETTTTTTAEADAPTPSYPETAPAPATSATDDGNAVHTPRPIPDSATLRAVLAARLPDYAIPAHFIRLDAFPLTANGKLDRERLPSPHVADATTVEAPRNADEAALVALWREVLEIPDGVPLGREADFFALGGRSLAANRLALRAARALGREVALRDLYAAPTPAALLARLTARGNTDLPRLPERQPAPLSPMQRRLWVISGMEDSGGVYHISGLTRLEGALDLDALRAALVDLCARHAVLRTRFVADASGTPSQISDPAGPPPLRVHDLAPEVTAAITSAAARPFDLACEWPLRVDVWRHAPDRHDVLVVLHHLAADGWSMPIFERELAQAYNARRHGHAPAWVPLPAQYRDLAAWQQALLDQGGAAADAAYWQDALAGELPILDLPTDRPRPAVRRFHGATFDHRLTARHFEALQTLAATHACSPFTVFLSLVQLLLARLSRQDEVIVGVPVSGRAHPASEGLIGFFVNTLPIRTRLIAATTAAPNADAGARSSARSSANSTSPSTPTGARSNDGSAATIEPSFTDLLAQVAATLTAAQQHQAYPFDRLVEELDLPRDPSRSPVFDVLVSLDEAAGTPPALDGLHATPLTLERSGSRCDLWWMLDLTGAVPTLRVEYDTDLFDPATIADWTTRLEQLLNAAARTPDAASTRLDWLAAGERERILAASHGFSGTAELPEQTAIDRFEAMARAHPDALALIDDHGQWTYRALDRAANALAHKLREHLVPSATRPHSSSGSTIGSVAHDDHAPGSATRPGDGDAVRHAEQQTHPDFTTSSTLGVPVVALMLERGPEMAVAMLATLKAGAAYLPIEPDSPAERAGALLADAAAQLLLVSPGIVPPVGTPDDAAGAVTTPPSTTTPTTTPTTSSAVASPDTLSPPSTPSNPSSTTPAVLTLAPMSPATHDTAAHDPAPVRATRADDPIYVMYTSGSTGRPKGVFVSHRAVLRLVLDSDYYRPEAGDRILQLSNYAFDGATFDCYAAFAHALPLCLPDRETVLDLDRLDRFVRAHGVNVSFVTTGLFNRLVDRDDTHATAPEGLPGDSPAPTPGDATATHAPSDHPPVPLLASFRRLYFGGQEASPAHVARAFQRLRPGALHHVYGPTEVTTFALSHEVSAADLVSNGQPPIGRPIARTSAYIVDRHGAPQPDGVPGELWLGGPGVAHGYLGRPELSAERFIPSPFVPGERLYRSGDLCVRRRDGVIVFLGRLDGLVKIRGYRIETGEIEARLNTAPGITRACVLARPSAGGHILVAYLKAAAGQRPLRSTLHAHLARWLPPYMIPTHCVVLDDLPLNANGKVDTRALPDPQAVPDRLLRDTTDDSAGADADPATAPDTTQRTRTPAQQVLTDVWCAVLGLERIGLGDNYFALGGDSIQALQIVHRLREAGWQARVTDLMRHPSIDQLAPLLVRDTNAATSATHADDASAADAANDTAPAPWAPAQHWFVAQDFARPAHFNQSMLVHIDPALAPERLQQAIDTLWQRHPGLRLRPTPDTADGTASGAHGNTATAPFRDAAGDNGEGVHDVSAQATAGAPRDAASPPTQQALPADAAPHVVEHICASAAEMQADAARRQGGFDLDSGPLFAAVRYRLPDGDRLFLIAHHWVIDGVSWRVLLGELRDLLDQRGLPPPPVPFSRWTRALSARAVDTAQRDYWREQAQAPVSALPLVAGSLASPLAARALHAFELSPGATASLTATGHGAYQTRGDELLLAAWALAVSRTLGAGAGADTHTAPAHALRITLESHGRGEFVPGIDISRTVGWFTAIFPLRLAPTSLALPTLIREVKESLRAVPDLGAGYGVLRWMERDPGLVSATPPSIGFNYLGRFDQDAALPVAVETTGDELAPETVLPHALDLTAEVRGERLHVRLVADHARLPAPWCEALASAYRDALDEIADHCLDPDAGALSPSDVDLGDIDLADLDAILDGLGKG